MNLGSVPLAFGFAVFCIMACECRGDIDCEIGDTLSIRIISSDTGEDLVVETDPRLTDMQLAVYTVINGKPIETIIYLWDIPSIEIKLDRANATYFVRAFQATDTIMVVNSRRVTECCGKVNDVQSVHLNGTLVEKDEFAEGWEVILKR
jgi:hypothetical protein